MAVRRSVRPGLSGRSDEIYVDVDWMIFRYLKQLSQCVEQQLGFPQFLRGTLIQRIPRRHEYSYASPSEFPPRPVAASRCGQCISADRHLMEVTCMNRVRRGN